jgi:glycine/sarcosine N-methyltransferase
LALFEHLARYYDRLFPVNEKSVAFFLNVFAEDHVRTVADIACGTGRYTLALASAGLHCIGLDLDGAMIAQAEAARQEAGLVNVRFVQGDMRILQPHMDSLDALICIGNSLANLTDPDDIRRALAEFHAVLTPGGTLVLQLVNFDRHQHQGLTFSDIVLDTPPLRFQRRYADGPNGLIRFETNLDFPCPDNPDMVCTEKDTTLIYPLPKDIMIGFLTEQRFSDIRVLGAYDGSPFTADSPASIFVARRR